MDAISDSELAANAAQGDAEAFSLLIERHYDRIYAMAYKWCRNRPDAQDAAQEVCIKLGEAIGQWRRDGAFTTWLYRIVLNTVRDMRRRQGTRSGYEGQFAQEEVMRPDEPSAEQVMLSRELYELVEALPDKLRETVLLVFGEELSHSQAAEILGCAETTVSWRIHEARKQLAGAMERRDG